MKIKINWTRINNDTNGNPRYVCHFYNLVSKKEQEKIDLECKERQLKSPNLYISTVSNCYDFALRRAKKIGGKKFNNKQYGGGIVFQSYNIEETEKEIKQLLKKDKQK